MSFSRGLLVAGLALQLGCGLKVGEKAPQDAPIAIGASNSACFSQITKRIDRLLAGELNEGQVREAIGCMRHSFESFKRKTRGEERNSFKPEEIRAFLHEYFIRDRLISDELLRDFMVIKQTAVGGALDRVTRSDLDHLIETLAFIEDQFVRLNPFMSDFNFSAIRLKAKGGEDLAELNQAVSTLELVAQNVGLRLASANSPYPTAHLESFMREIRHFAGWEEVFQNSRSPSSWVKLVDSLKVVLTGKNGGVIKPQDWPVILSAAAGWYGAYLKTSFAKSQKAMLSGVGLEAVIRAGDDVIRLIQESVDNQPDAILRYDQLDNLIDALAELNLLPQVGLSDGESQHPVRPQSLKKAMRAIFDRIFGDSKVAWRNRKSQGISRLVTAQMSTEFARWADIQRLLVKIFGSDATSSSDRVVTLAEKLGPIGASQNLMGLMADKPAGPSLDIVRQIEQKMRPLFRPGETQVFLTESGQLAKFGVVHGFHNLSIMNVVRAMTSFLMNGYSSFSEGGPMGAGISAEELQAFYLDFRDLGVDLQLMDPRSDSAGLRAFREANLFTYSANGLIAPEDAKRPADSLLRYMEAMEYISFIYSGGVLGSSIYKGMMAPDRGLCREQSQSAPLSVHGFRMIERSCFRNNLVEVLIPNLASMPVMKRVFERATPPQRLAMSDNLMRTIYSPKTSNPNFVEWQEITTLAVITHYTEAVMTRYNEDQDEALNTNEVWNAYDTFKGYMIEMSKGRCRDVVGTWSTNGGPGSKVNVAAGQSWGWDSSKQWLKEWIKLHGCGSIPDFVAQAVFAHIVETGEVPTSLWQVNFVPRLKWFGVEFNVDRSGLLKVFAALVKANAEAANAASVSTSR